MNKTLWQYYVDLATRISEAALQDVHSLEQWQAERAKRKEEFLNSVGLLPFPEKCDLRANVRGEFAGPGYRARKLAYQILPDCWGSGNLYLPDPLPKTRLPAVLYACGHTGIGTYGLQSQALRWSGRGYACFIFDTIKQNDNPGWHHGLFAGESFDWISRGYTSAGGELYNSIRALDVLAGSPEVDAGRIGVTGMSGGGAHTFFTAIADDRIRAAAPVAGVSSLKAALADRMFRQHCDCMYPYGRHQRDTVEFAALVAPRPLLFCFASEDALFTPEEYRALTARTRKIYRLYGCEPHCDLFEYPGPHDYSDAVLDRIDRWFDQHVAGQEHPHLKGPIAEKSEAEVAIYNGVVPVPDRLDLLPELLTTRKGQPLPRTAAEWPAIRKECVQRLRQNVFSWLDRNSEKLSVECVGAWPAGSVKTWRYRAELGGMELWLEVLLPAGARKMVAAVCGLDERPAIIASQLQECLPGEGLAIIEPRATGLNAADLRAEDGALYRVGALVGLTPVLLWLSDLQQVMPFLHGLPQCQGMPWCLYGRGEAGVVALYHTVFDEEIAGVILNETTDSHQSGGYIPGILKEMDLIQAVGLVAPRPSGVASGTLSRWQSMLGWGVRVYERLGIRDRHVLGKTLPTVAAGVLQSVTANTLDAGMDSVQRPPPMRGP